VSNILLSCFEQRCCVLFFGGPVVCSVFSFPTDEFHLLTLSTVLETASGLVEGVDVKSIVVNLTDRLVSFVKNNRERVNSSKDKLDMFAIFFNAISKITQVRKHQLFFWKFFKKGGKNDRNASRCLLKMCCRCTSR
jgi:hypothetical protein